VIDRLGTKGVVGLALTLSSAIAFIGALLNSRDDSDIFLDNLDNEIDPGGDITRLLVAVGLILLVNGLALLLLSLRGRR
jgi:hypothetical protein